MTASETHTTGERADLLTTLATRRYFLRNTLRGLSDEQAAARTTVSELCLGGLVKHVTQVERNWAGFIVAGPSGMGADDASIDLRLAGFRMAAGDTVASLLDGYADVARQTEDVIGGLPDLDVAHPLPEAPWFEPGAHWSARRVLLHVIGETAQHAGHADILREAIDGAKSMG